MTRFVIQQVENGVLVTEEDTGKLWVATSVYSIGDIIKTVWEQPE